MVGEQRESILTECPGPMMFPIPIRLDLNQGGSRRADGGRSPPRQGGLGNTSYIRYGIVFHKLATPPLPSVMEQACSITQYS